MVRIGLDWQARWVQLGNVPVRLRYGRRGKLGSVGIWRDPVGQARRGLVSHVTLG